MTLWWNRARRTAKPLPLVLNPANLANAFDARCALKISKELLFQKFLFTTTAPAHPFSNDNLLRHTDLQTWWVISNPPRIEVKRFVCTHISPYVQRSCHKGDHVSPILLNTLQVWLIISVNLCIFFLDTDRTIASPKREFSNLVSQPAG